MKKPPFILVLPAVLVATLLAGCAVEPDRPPPTFPLYETLQLGDQMIKDRLGPHEIPALRQLPVILGSNDPNNGLTLTTAADTKITVTTCAEYQGAIKEGSYAYTTFDMTMEGFFKQACGILDAYEGAQVAEHNYLANVIITLPRHLPASVCSGITRDDDDEYQRMGKRGVTVEQMIIDKQARMVSAADLEIEIEYGTGIEEMSFTTKTILSEIGRADFNNDGYQDILLYNATYSTEGSYRTYSMVLIERMSPSAPASVREYP